MAIGRLIWKAKVSSDRSIPCCLSEEYCQWETFNATCGYNHVILITSATYGRMRIGRCVPYDYFVGCTTDVHDQLSARCSARQRCSVPIPDTELFKVHPCRKDLVAYLEATYQCVPGTTPCSERPGVGQLALSFARWYSMKYSRCEPVFTRPLSIVHKVCLLSEIAICDETHRSANNQLFYLDTHDTLHEVP